MSIIQEAQDKLTKTELAIALVAFVPFGALCVAIGYKALLS